MIRAGRTLDGTWYINRGVGRGIWLCADGVCSEEVQSGQIARSLRRSVSESDVEQLRQLINRSKQ